MIILVVEDLKEEQERAKEALRGLGFKPAVAGTLMDAYRIFTSLGERISGIITDIHFLEENDADAIKPCGLAVVAWAVTNGIPVAVCSDIDHHHAWYIKSVIDALADHPGYVDVADIPMIMDRKDWTRAGEELKKLIIGLQE